MTLEQRITALVALGKHLAEGSERLEMTIMLSKRNNQWFTEENIQMAITAIVDEFLAEEKLRNWLSHYEIGTHTTAKKIGLIPAGNIPMVGFQDILCVFAAGHQVKVKFSEKDKFLIPYCIEFLKTNYPETVPYFEEVKMLKDIDGVIATGSNNSSRYFETYFQKYPNIIRKNRNSVAVIHGDESHEDFLALGIDVFRYFGLGCRNVSKIYVPKDYDFDGLLEGMHEYREIVHHNKYKNNFDYNYTLLILNKVKHLSTGCILLTEDTALQSRIATMHYEFYENERALVKDLTERKEEIQCIVSKKEISGLKTLPFGKAQSPTLMDYADDVDVMRFLISL